MPTSQTTLTGTYDISSLLAARFQSVASFGEEKIAAILAADLAAHNAITNSMLSELAEVTADRQRMYGSSVGGEMVEVDEYGASPSQKAAPGSTVGFPLRKLQYTLGWTNTYLKNATPADLAVRTKAAEKANLRGIQTLIKRAMYGSANYTFYDHLVDNVQLAVKRFLNADSAAIPNGPNGEVYVASTHTHYVGAAALTAAVLTAGINNVIEHGFGGKVMVVFNKADEAAVRALTGFVAYQDPRLILQTTEAPAQRLDISRLDNRAIGIFGGAEVWIKSWAIANYFVVYDASNPGKPLAIRRRTAGEGILPGLSIAAELDGYPLHAEFMEDELGIGVWTRTNGQVTYFANATYADPVI